MMRVGKRFDELMRNYGTTILWPKTMELDKPLNRAVTQSPRMRSSMQHANFILQNMLGSTMAFSEYIIFH